MTDIDVRGLVGQQIIWDEYMRVFGFSQLIELISDESPELAQPRRQAELMRARWDNLPLQESRPGHKYFPRMLKELVNKPLLTEPYGDYTEASDDVFVMGEKAARLITDAEATFQPVLPTGRGYDPTDIFDGFEYLKGFTTGVARFLKLDGSTWTPYIAATDSPMPETPGFSSDD